jgi:hypothetical protein
MKSAGRFICCLRDRIAKTPHGFRKAAAFEQRMRMFEDFVDCYRSHAAMIYRTVAQHARRTIGRVAQDLGFGRKRARR